MFLLINYCSDIFSASVLAIFRELVSLCSELPDDDHELRPKHVGAVIN